MIYSPMSDSVDDLILDLLIWLDSGPRPYAGVLDAWRTSCPRLPVWEEATERGFIKRFHALGSRVPLPAERCSQELTA
jgi:D-3-phosphoglycerate dehydrogenase